MQKDERWRGSEATLCCSNTLIIPVKAKSIDNVNTSLKVLMSGRRHYMVNSFKQLRNEHAV